MTKPKPAHSHSQMMNPGYPYFTGAGASATTPNLNTRPTHFSPNHFSPPAPGAGQWGGVLHDPTTFAPNMNPVIPNVFSGPAAAAAAGHGQRNNVPNGSQFTNPNVNPNPASFTNPNPNVSPFANPGAAAAAFANNMYGSPYANPSIMQSMQTSAFATPFSHPNVNPNSRPPTNGPTYTPNHPNRDPNHQNQHSSLYANQNPSPNQHPQAIVYDSPYSTTSDRLGMDEPPVIPIPNPNGKGYVLLHQPTPQRQQQEQGLSRRPQNEELQPIPPTPAITGPHPAWASAWADPNGPFAAAIAAGGGGEQPPPAPQQQQQQQPQQQLSAVTTHQQQYLSQNSQYSQHPHHSADLPPGGPQPPPLYGVPAQPPAPSYGVPPPPPGIPPAPAHNTTEMTREMLLPVLDRFSELLCDYFEFSDRMGASDNSPGSDGSGSGSGNERGRDKGKGRDGPKRPKQIRLAVHGGACMLLHPVLRALSLEMPLVGAPLPGSSSNLDELTQIQQQNQVLKNIKMENLARRTTTRDVDVIMRGFVDDYKNVGAPARILTSSAAGGDVRQGYPQQTPYQGYPGYPAYGYPAQRSSNTYPSAQAQADAKEDADPDSPRRTAQLDAASRLKACIRRTAKYFPGLGLDWMNADADVALPLGADPQTHETFDPIHRSTFTATNIQQYTVYTSPNGRLQLVGVPPAWSIALKLARWGRRDYADVGILLRSATSISGFHWTPEVLQGVLEKDCWAMGYSRWDQTRIRELKERVGCAVRMIEGWGIGTGPGAAQQMNGYGQGYSHGYGYTGGANGGVNELGLYMQAPIHGQQQVGPAVQQQQQQRRRDDRDWEREDARAARMASAQARSKSKSKHASNSRSKSRARSQSSGPHEIFIPPPADDDDYDFGRGYGYEEPEDRRERGHARHISRSIPVGSMYSGGNDGTTSLSAATAVAPFNRQQQQYQGPASGTHGARLWRRPQSGSRSTHNERDKKSKKSKQRDRQRRSEQQRRHDERSGWAMPPITPIDTDSDTGGSSEEGSDTQSESGDATDDTDDDEGDKENRDRGSAWRQANIYGPSKKRPAPLAIPPPLTNEQAVQQQQQQQRQPLYSQQPHGQHYAHDRQHPAYAQQMQPNPHQQQHEQQQQKSIGQRQQPARTQSHPLLFSQPQAQPQAHPQPTPYSTPQPQPPYVSVPTNANASQLAQFQFEQQMRTLEVERQHEQAVKETMNRIAKRVVTRGSTM